MGKSRYRIERRLPSFLMQVQQQHSTNANGKRSLANSDFHGTKLLDSAAKYENSLTFDLRGHRGKESQTFSTRSTDRPNHRRKENLIFLLAVRGFTTSERAGAPGESEVEGHNGRSPEVQIREALVLARPPPLHATSHDTFDPPAIPN